MGMVASYLGIGKGFISFSPPMRMKGSVGGQQGGAVNLRYW